MIIKSVSMKPFAGIRERTIDLEAGLNVILGPNEAGKSTFFRALRAALLEPVNLTGSRFEAKFRAHLPAAGGDVLRVLVSAVAAGEHINLEKEWKPGNRKGRARLLRAAGAEIVDPDRVEQAIGELLPAGRATVESLLLSSQSMLHETVDAGLPHGSNEEIAAILRSAVMETGGVSLERFFAELETREQQMLSHFDRSSDYPEKGRGLENPWRRDVGEVLSLWYRRERLGKERDSARAWEEKMEEVDGSLTEREERFLEIDEAVRRDAAMREEIARRLEGEQRLRAIEFELKNLSSVSMEWPKTLGRLEGFPDHLSSLEKRIAAGEEALEAVRRVQELHESIERARRLQTLKGRLDEAAQEVAAVPRVDAAHLASLRTLHAEREGLSSRIEGAKLHVSLSLTEGGSLTIRTSDDREKEQRLDPGTPVTFDSEGRLSVTGEHFSLSVRSGSEEIDTIIERRNRCTAELSKRVTSLGAQSLEEAEEAAGVWARSESRRVQAAEALAEELGQESYEEATAVLSDESLRQGSAHSGDPAKLYEELASLKASLRESREKERELRSLIAEWESQFATQERLQERVGELRYEKSRLEEELAGLAALPDETKTAKEFLERLKRRESERERVREEREELRRTRASLEAAPPEESAEELERRLEDAQSAFSSAKRRAAAISRVNERARAISAELDSGTFDPLTERFRYWLSVTARERFHEASLDKTEAREFVTTEGIALSPDQLSWGTRDSVSLALRLTLAESAIGRQKGASTGFLLFDDPMVDLDPRRRECAARAIARFAEGCQTIILTCHPEHARDLGGNLIELDGA